MSFMFRNRDLKNNLFTTVKELHSHNTAGKKGALVAQE